jgi:hypothetical protein
MSLIKLHNISNKAILHTGCKKRVSPSILTKPHLVYAELRLIRSQTIIIICKKFLLLIIYNLL